MFDKSIIEKKLSMENKRLHGTKETNFIELLRTHNAVIAGSYVLSLYVTPSFKAGDIDIYINEKHFDKFIISLIDSGLFWNEYSRVIVSSDYDESFFNKNGIKFKVRGTLYLKHNDISVDIMIVYDNRNIKDVVSNFDLSFCEIWYDGKDVVAAREKDIINKKGVLKKDYHDAYHQKNRFIHDRIAKYSDRGFAISLENNNDDIVINKHLLPSKPKLTGVGKTLKDENVEKTFVKKYITTQLDSIMFEKSFRPTLPCLYSAGVSHIKKKISNFYVADHIDSFKLKLCYKYCNCFNKYSLFELCINSRLYFGIDEKTIVDYMSDWITLLEQNRELTDKIENIDKSIKVLRKCLKQINDNVKYFIMNLQSKYNISKDDKYKMERINFDTKVVNQLQGYDIIEMETKNVGQYLSKSGNIALINFENDQIKGDVNLLDSETLLVYILDIRDRWFYECNSSIRDINKSTPYINLPTNKGAIYVYWYELIDMYFKSKNGKNVFIYKATDKNVNKSISHKNAFNENSNWVGAWHCQDGTNFRVSTIYYSDDISNDKSLSKNSLDYTLKKNKTIAKSLSFDKTSSVSHTKKDKSL